jgi:hypothetical protein
MFCRGVFLVFLAFIHNDGLSKKRPSNGEQHANTAGSEAVALFHLEFPFTFFYVPEVLPLLFSTVL